MSRSSTGVTIRNGIQGLAAALLVIAAVSGCGPGAAKLAAARDDVTAATQAHLDAFERGDFDAWGATFTRDGLLIAADPYEAILGPDSIAAEMHRDFDEALDQGLHIDLHSTDLRVGVTRRLNRAWVSDELSYVVHYGNDSLDMRLRFSGVLVKDDHGWRFDVANFSRPLAGAQVAAAMSSGEVPRPVRIPRDGHRGELDRTLRRALADTTRLLKLVGKGDNVQVIGPAPGERAIGGDAARALLRSELHGRGPFRLVGDEMLVRHRGALTWVAANLERDEEGPAGSLRVPYRAVFAFVMCGENCWTLVQAHVSNGIKDPA